MMDSIGDIIEPNSGHHLQHLHLHNGHQQSVVMVNTQTGQLQRHELNNNGEYCNEPNF